ncbi:hypothetical protein [uncultured Cyclobacterium sp.]|uniref:hypothetical protein n=1 Tax=uncultured Cyclobacterium sp. TaxID=453820 RepID=UPI0030ED4055|tara:strand:+ start:148130 stop:148327 length:198 start_codon:yes stop_codon:yes gene_type:complete
MQKDAEAYPVFRGKVETQESQDVWRFHPRITRVKLKNGRSADFVRCGGSARIRGFIAHKEQQEHS